MGALENLRKEAKRWLKAIRAGDEDARARMRAAYPAAPDQPGLRDTHHALAREHGHDNWEAMKKAVTQGAAAAPTEPATDRERLISIFLQSATWDHHTHGVSDHRMNDRAAQRHLARHPDIASADLSCAIVSGNIEFVRAVLAERPEAAREAGGARGWTPILYLAYTRFTHAATLANAVDIARLLIDAGADPGDFYMAGDSEYSCLVGAAGEGEQDSPRQPYARELYGLLLERGAGPFDIQVLYNTHFSADMLWWLEPTYQHCVNIGRTAEWADPAWSMLDMGGYGNGAYFILKAAIEKSKPALATWALDHGAGANAAPPAGPKSPSPHTPYQLAVLYGETGIAEQLLAHGAEATAPAPRPLEAFISLCMRLDRAGAEAFLRRHPEYRHSHLAMFEAAARDRPDVIALLLDLGVPLEIADGRNTRALHKAAIKNALRAATLLIERGAEIDPIETSHGGPPIGWAVHGGHKHMIELLSRHSRDIWRLTFCGCVDRVRELLREDPALARQVDTHGMTPLWWLPDDEDKAIALVDLLVAAGADPARTNVRGRTAADWARTRGMEDVARRLGGATTGLPAPAAEDSNADPMSPPIVPIVIPPPVASGAPVEMRAGFTMRLRDGVRVPTENVWNLLVACRDGHLDRVTELLAECPSLITCDYNYMSPLHLAVREGHLQIVRFLAERGAVNPKYETYPYRESLITVAIDRGYAAIAAILEEHSRTVDPDRPQDEGGHVEYVIDFERRRFQQLVNARNHGAVQEMLERRADLARDPFAFWAEGILSMPANAGDHRMIELLMQYGAAVPEITKWGREYYFKRDDTAAFLMARGMSPHHMNVHRTTLLHGMAQLGELRRATLLLDHGADVNAVDEEFRSTPLGLAARWGRERMVKWLLDRGADRQLAGADWATPVAWARTKGHTRIAALLST